MGSWQKRLNDIQAEINLIKNGVNPLTSDEFTIENAEIKSTYEKVLNELLKEMYSVMLEFKQVDIILNQLLDAEKKVIYLRYVKGYSWQRIASETYISRTHCFCIKNKAIDMLKKMKD